MRDDSFENDSRKIWQNQPTEPFVMTSETVRQKVREVHAKTRKQLVRTLAGPFIVAFFYAFGVKQFPLLQQMQHPLFAFALVWSLAGLYFLNRGKWAVAMPQDAGLSDGLEFCRREFEWQRDYLRRVLLWGFGPVLLAIGTLILAMAIVAGRTMFPNATPFMTLVAVWIAAYFVIRVRQQRELQREIDELNKVERENSPVEHG